MWDLTCEMWHVRCVRGEIELVLASLFHDIGHLVGFDDKIFKLL